MAPFTFASHYLVLHEDGEIKIEEGRNMSNERYLTKSRFKIALDCETKLFYTRKPERYPDTSVDDSFLESLAEGGFQVGELARLYHPGGVMIHHDRGYKKPLKLTNELLNQENVIIYEPAFLFDNCFIRADVLVKVGNKVDLIEVKSKSFDGKDSMDFLKANGNLDSGWQPYVYDVAFQKYVLMNACPQFEVRSYLMLADKNAEASGDGLNQKFLIVKDATGNVSIKLCGDTSPEALGEEILIKVRVDDLIDRIFEGTDMDDPPVMLFPDLVKHLACHYSRDEKIVTSLSSSCGGCEFRCSEEQRVEGKQDGFRECWKGLAGFVDSDFDKPSIFDLWDFRRKNRMIQEQKYFLEQLIEDDIGESDPSLYGMSRTDRQRTQLAKAISGDTSMYLLKDELKEEMDNWIYPLHFIDFETSAVAIPFYKGMRPYEGIAFQFSHHQVEGDGRITHAGEYLNVEHGKFPNFDFVRKLKAQLEIDEGSVFMYSYHENTYLNIIYRQLRSNTTKEVPDRDELCEWIQSITTSSSSQSETWEGPRKMIDLCDTVKKYYYDPYTNGSNSLKSVLPAVLNRSKYLQEKYAKPIYGSPDMTSLNFTNKIWIMKDGHKIKNPYDLLPPLFQDITDEELQRFITDPDLKEGGAAMMAYARMQFSEMPETERENVIKGLLRYCELDTFAMVLVWEFFRNEVYD